VAGEGGSLMARRQQMWPTTLTWNDAFKALPEPEQNMVFKLWLSSSIDAAGFHPLQIAKWARSSTPHRSNGEMRQVVDRLAGTNWIAVDHDTEEVLLRPYIRYDAATQPQWYVAACRAVQAAQSRALRLTAWEQIQDVYPPPFKSKSDGKRNTTQMVQDAYDELYVFMERDPDGSRIPDPSPFPVPFPFPQPSGSLPEAIPKALRSLWEPSDPLLCSKCDERPAQGGQTAWRPELCADCADQERHPSMRRNSEQP
jgi:hypothetical protein